MESLTARRRVASAPAGERRRGLTGDLLTIPHGPRRRRASAWQRTRALLLTGCALALAACGSSSPPSNASTSGSPDAVGASPTVSGARLAYAALGASETYGIGASPITLGYAYRVRDALHLGETTFADVGIPAATLADAYQPELTSALSIQPTLCTVFFGANDLRDRVPLSQFTSDLQDLVSTLRRAGAHVLIVGLPDLGRLPALRASGIANLAEISAQWNGAMAQVASTTGSAFLALDAYTSEIAAHPEDIAPDGLHPSNQGHARLATIILAALHAWRYIP